LNCGEVKREGESEERIEDRRGEGKTQRKQRRFEREKLRDRYTYANEAFIETEAAEPPELPPADNKLDVDS
jgi:hypothetical protein